MSYALHHLSPVAAAAWLALQATAVQAQTAEPANTNTSEQVTITGQKVETEFGGKTGIPLSRMPQSVQVISADDLIAQGVLSVGDALRDVPSANVGNSRVARYQSFSLKIRGFLADQARNGLRQRYYEDIDASALSNVERIEVLKGPSSVIFGHSAVGGVISLITKTPQKAFGGEVALSLGSDDRKQATLDVGGALDSEGRLRARLTAEVERSGTFVDFQDMTRNNLGLNLAWDLAPSVSAHMVAEYIERKTLGNPGLPVDGTVKLDRTAPLPRSLYLGEPTQSPLSADAPLLQLWADIRLNDDWTLTPRYQYQQFNSAFTQIRVRAMGEDGFTLARNGRIGAEDDTYQIAQLDLTGRLRTAGITHHLLAGLEWNDEHSTFHQENLTNVGSVDVRNPVYTYGSGTLPTATFAFDLVGDVRSTALYLQDRASITPDWDLLLGLRHSRFSTHSVFNGSVDDARVSATTWQVGTNLKLSPVWALFGGVNTGLDMESAAGGRDANGQAFKPERSSQVELGLRADAGAWRGSAAVFQVKRQDALTTDPVNPDFQIQTGEQRVRGLEMEAEWRPAAGWRLQGGWSVMKGEVTRSNDGDQGAELGDTPRRLATLNVAWALPGTAWELRAGANGVSSRLLTHGSDVRLPGYGLLDLGAGWQSGPWRVDLTLNNALDKRYFTAAGNSFGVYPGDPRQWGLRVARSL